MCTYSMAVDFGKNIPDDHWNQGLYLEFQLLLTRMAEIDRKLGLADCEDPSKQEWMRNIEKRLEKIEKELPKKATAPVKKGKSTKPDPW